jgi:hypothetical protein
VATVRWLGAPADEAFLLKEQARDAAGIACAAVEDVQRVLADAEAHNVPVGDTSVYNTLLAAAMSAEQQSAVADDSAGKVLVLMGMNPSDVEIAQFSNEAGSAANAAKLCAIRTRQIADGYAATGPTTSAKKSGGGGWLAALAAALVIGGLVIAGT